MNHNKDNLHFDIESIDDYSLGEPGIFPNRSNAAPINLGIEENGYSLGEQEVNGHYITDNSFATISLNSGHEGQLDDVDITDTIKEIIEASSYPPVGLQDINQSSFDNNENTNLFNDRSNNYLYVKPMDDDNRSSYSFNNETGSEIAEYDSIVGLSESSDNINVKKRLNSRLREKLRAEGKDDTVVDPPASTTAIQQPSPEEEQKQNDRKERNKEAARRSRQKKKDDEDKLKASNVYLKEQNQKLIHSIASLKVKITKCHEFIGHHDCVNSAPVLQQDHGDDVYQETGRGAVNSRNMDALNAEDSETITELLDGFYEMGLSLENKSVKPQSIEQLLSFLQDDGSHIVTSGTSYEDERLLFPSGNNTITQKTFSVYSISEATLSGNSFQVNNYNNVRMMGDDRGVIAFEERGPINVVPTTIAPNATNDMVLNSRSSTTSFNEPRGSGHAYLYAWATQTENQSSEEKEAYDQIVALQPPTEKKLQPPPEKKPRFE